MVSEKHAGAMLHFKERLTSLQNEIAATRQQLNSIVFREFDSAETKAQKREQQKALEDKIRRQRKECREIQKDYFALKGVAKKQKPKTAKIFTLLDVDDPLWA